MFLLSYISSTLSIELVLFFVGIRTSLIAVAYIKCGHFFLLFTAIGKIFENVAFFGDILLRMPDKSKKVCYFYLEHAKLPAQSACLDGTINTGRI